MQRFVWFAHGQAYWWEPSARIRLFPAVYRRKAMMRRAIDPFETRHHAHCAGWTQDGVCKYVDLVCMFGALAQECKTVLSARLGIDCGPPIPPANILSEEERREMLRVAQSLGLTERRTRN